MAPFVYDEVQLLHNAREGHAVAAERLFVSYLKESRSIRGLLRRMLSNSSDREEMLHEIYLQLVSGQNQFRGDARLSTYIYQVARLTVFQKLRRDNMKKRKRIEGNITELDGVPARSQSSPEYNYVRKEARRILRELIEALPEAYRQALRLKVLDDLSYAEVAESLNLPVKTVYTRIHKGKRALSTELKERGLGSGLLN